MITYRLPCPLTIVDMKVDYKKVDRQSSIILLHQRNLSTSKKAITTVLARNTSAQELDLEQ